MGIADYILLILIGIGVIAAVRYIYRSKKVGRCIGCSGSCEGCKKGKGRKS
ncbi:MAG: FeoB-associated Cys-rich membrane protein [Lachnospiraceae bacterium]